MPIFDFECPSCKRQQSELCDWNTIIVCRTCRSCMKKLPSSFGIAIAGNVGPKLRTRVALSDEMEKQGMSTPLYASELEKDQVRWASKKVGLK
ncbi:hypothetical protein LCGC14_3014260 [marine sediment metagenome]|uniref:Putative regulatory protein FmdB zinc ribbon domain-containing protein n=1 Tax=marine sediment metagenome TaxID=412755 RepID=A0A0F8WX91_9ZZZZ